MIRHLTTLVLLGGVFLAPWWCVVAGVVLCVLVYRRYIEGVGIAVLLDVLYGAALPVLFDGYVTLAIIVLFVASLASERYFRSHVRL